uniref:Transposase n=1 Tax=Heterorhabditis bacteriophora TaxID=37862 RepID=A0A1I7WI49_HETBA
MKKIKHKLLEYTTIKIKKNGITIKKNLKSNKYKFFLVYPKGVVMDDGIHIRPITDF